VVTWCLRGEDRDLEKKIYGKLVEATDPAVLSVVYSEAVKNPNFKTRIILLGVAGNHVRPGADGPSRDNAAFAALGQALKDPSRPVVLTAVKWLRESQDAARGVPLLIEGLKVAASGSRASFDIRNTLKDLTGNDLEYAADWKNYWDAHKTAVGAPPPPKKLNPTKVVKRSEFFSVPVESNRILFIIDISGSMTKKDPPIPEMALPEEEKQKKGKGPTVVQKTKATPPPEKKAVPDDPEKLPLERQRIYRVKKELVRLIKSLPDTISFSIISFSHEVHVLGDTPGLIPASDGNKKKAEDWVNALQPNGETWTDSAFEKAFKEFKDFDTIYFLSDGAPYRKGANIPEGPVREGIRDQNRFVKARIHTFGFVQEGRNLRRFLENVAKENDGKFVALP
jgi:hypothetical protein